MATCVHVAFPIFDPNVYTVNYKESFFFFYLGCVEKIHVFCDKKKEVIPKMSHQRRLPKCLYCQLQGKV